MSGERGSIFNTTLWSGLFVVAAGVILLLDHMGMVHAGQIFRYWPVILIVLGLSAAFGSKEGKCCGGGAIGGGLLATWGTLLLLQNLGYLTWGQIWPIILIVVGVVLIWQSFRAKQIKVLTGGKLNPSSVFASVERSITDQNFEQGKAETVFGSIELDFLSANMAGDSAVLQVAVVFGSVEVRVPTTWNVVLETTAVFGSAENKTRAPLPGDKMKTLTVRGEVVFGSVEVKN